MPNVLQFALACEKYGADGITVHPRPDERHIKYSDVYELKANLTKELNIEGYPDERFLKLVKEVKPTQCTLVPDAPNILTSNNGWDLEINETMLKHVVADLNKLGIRVSLFVNPSTIGFDKLHTIGNQRIELYTGTYAANYLTNKQKAIQPFVNTATIARQLGLEINAGHDLSQENIYFFKQNIPFLNEVSIGQALISEALYQGVENTIHNYNNLLK